MGKQRKPTNAKKGSAPNRKTQKSETLQKSKPKIIMLQVKMDPPRYEKLQLAAKNLGVPLSAFVRVGLSRYMDQEDARRRNKEWHDYIKLVAMRHGKTIEEYTRDAIINQLKQDQQTEVVPAWIPPPTS